MQLASDSNNRSEVPKRIGKNTAVRQSRRLFRSLIIIVHLLDDLVSHSLYAATERNQIHIVIRLEDHQFSVLRDCAGKRTPPLLTGPEVVPDKWLNARRGKSRIGILLG